MRRKLDDVAPRTIRLHLPTYNAILEFFDKSPSGIKASDAIRQVVMHFGLYCQRQMRAGRTASPKDLLAAEQAVLEIMGEQNAEQRNTATGPTARPHGDTE